MSVLALVLSLATQASPVITDGFTPHPLSERLDLPGGNVSMLDTPWKKCGTSDTTKAPAWSFTLAAPMKDLELAVDAPAVLVGPDGGFLCLRGEPVTFASWPAGTWKVFLFSSSLRLGANVKLSQPSRVKAAADSERQRQAQDQPSEKRSPRRSAKGASATRPASSWAS